ncbi:hypothetical protein LG331_09835 [Vreelandella aquamarina]|uniref:hypothetical protein n=1 Tax=Vreelandella aquamarina TaxID=77097 RepID=UPI00384C472A
MTTKEEFTALRRKVRYYQRQAWASTVAFVIAVALLAIFISQAVESRAQLTRATAVIEQQAARLAELEDENATMFHHILSVQGRLNSCLISDGRPAIDWEKYQ